MDKNRAFEKAIKCILSELANEQERQKTYEVDSIYYEMTQDIIEHKKLTLKSLQAQQRIDDGKDITYCVECKWKNTNRCPAYDTPMDRTSLRIKFCSEGESVNE